MPDPSVGQTETSEPWGWKVTIHAYGTGSPPSGIPKACELVANTLGADDFVGADMKVIQTKPRDQGGS